MKILILCNMPPKKISDTVGIKKFNYGGWISALTDELLKKEEINLVVCYKNNDYKKDKISDKLVAYGFSYREKLIGKKYMDQLYDYFRKVIEEENPDIIHIFGTEHIHSNIMVKAFNNPNRTVIHIQGLVYYISSSYTQGLPESVVNKKTIAELIRRNNVSHEQKKYKKRGLYELEAIRGVNHVMGRTDWDKACCIQINHDINYHYVQEIIRSPFYSGYWDVNSCKRHSLFMSQAQLPIKGLHYVIEAMAILKDQWEDVQLNIGGLNIYSKSTLKRKIVQSSYANYILKLIKKYNLETNVHFLGTLDSEEMKKQLLDCNVFILGSTIENSPNSIAEAMLLGVPVVSSDVGGVTSIMEHRKEGYVYPVDEPYMMAFYIDKLFKDDAEAMILGSNAALRAHKTYDKDQIVQDVIDVYKEMIN